MSSIFNNASQPNAEQASQNKPESGRKNRFVQTVTHLLAAAVVVLTLSCVGCQSPPKIPQQLLGEEPGALAPGDVLKFAFPGTPDLNQSQRIQADGKVSLPLVGMVVAGGKRLGKFQEEVDQLYKAQLKNNAVVVSLDSSSATVSVIGAVARPGKVALERPLTLLEAITEAGGPASIGTLKGVVLIRNSNGQHFTQSFDLSAALKGRKVDGFYVKAYDIVYVPERFF